MKKRIISLVLLVALVSTLFAGCSFEEIEKKLVKDDGTVDPATIMVADLLKKTVAKDSFIDEATEYVLYDDNTAAVKKYNGEEANIEIASTIDVDGTEYTVVGIDNKAFYKNSGIQTVSVSDTVQVIGNFAFMSCNNITDLTIGKNVAYIGVSAFQADKAPQNNRQKRLDAEGKEILNREGDPTFYESVGNLKHIEWLGAPKVIAEKAFYLNDKLDEIALPVGVERIGDWAFAKCVTADKIILPEGLTEIGEYCFIKNIGVKEIVIPSTLEVISQSAFYRNSSAETITIADGVKAIHQGAFEECESVTNINIPQSVQTIDKYCFYHCLDLKDVTVSSATQIDDGAFLKNKDVNISKF